MDLYAELDKLTAPPFTKITCRVLSRDEIEALESAGQITRIDDIPYLHRMGRISIPAERKFNSYDRAVRNRHRYV